MTKRGSLYLISQNSDEGNEYTDDDIMNANKKGWTVWGRSENKTWIELKPNPSANIITMKTSKAVGETIELDMNSTGEVTFTGIEEAPRGGGYYVVTNPDSITIIGEVKWLHCVEEQITSLDVSKNTALERLDCYDNQLTSLDVSKSTALELLYCDGNELTSLDVSKNTALKGLYCDGNELTSLDVSKNTALKGLYCDGNELTSLDVSKNTELTVLYCHNNQLTSLDLTHNGALQWLSCYCNQIKGVKMNTLIVSLPGMMQQQAKAMARTRTGSNGGSIVLVDRLNPAEGNEFSDTDLSTAASKGWTVYDNHGDDGNGNDGQGDVRVVLSDPTGIIDLSEPSAGQDAPEAYYDLDGRRLETPRKGINIIRMKSGKVVKKAI